MQAILDLPFRNHNKLMNFGEKCHHFEEELLQKQDEIRKAHQMYLDLLENASQHSSCLCPPSVREFGSNETAEVTVDDQSFVKDIFETAECPQVPIELVNLKDPFLLDNIKQFQDYLKNLFDTLKKPGNFANVVRFKDNLYKNFMNQMLRIEAHYEDVIEKLRKEPNDDDDMRKLDLELESKEGKKYEMESTVYQLQLEIEELNDLVDMYESGNEVKMIKEELKKRDTQIEKLKFRLKNMEKRLQKDCDNNDNNQDNKFEPMTDKYGIENVSALSNENDSMDTLDAKTNNYGKLGSSTVTDLEFESAGTSGIRLETLNGTNSVTETSSRDGESELIVVLEQISARDIKSTKTNVENSVELLNKTNDAYTSNSEPTEYKCATPSVFLTDDISAVYNTDRANFVCSACGKIFASKKRLKIHFQRNFIARNNGYKCESLEKPTSKNQFQHSICQKAFKKKFDLQIHPKRHRSFGKNFTQAGNMRSPERLHGGQRLFACETCGKTFTDISNLGRHKRVHTGKRPFACKTCGKTFTYPSNLGRHKRVHTGKRPYTCKICKKSFMWDTSLVIHERKHTGERPYACKICNKTFIGSSNLKSHEKIHTYR